MSAQTTQTSTAPEAATATARKTAAPRAHPMGRFGPPRACPEIATGRLSLGPMTRDDWPAYAAMMASDRARFMGGPLDIATSWGWFCSDIAGWDLTGAGALAIREDGVVIGQISLNDKPNFPEPEIGWQLYDGYEGRNYATEAAAAVLEWVRAKHRPKSLVSYCDPDNAPSIALARRLGAVQDDTAASPETGTLVLRHWSDAP